MDVNRFENKQNVPPTELSAIEKIEYLSKRIVDGEVSKETIKSFNLWHKNMPSSSFLKPLKIDSPESVIEVLPHYGNCLFDKKIILYLEKDNFSEEDIERVFVLHGQKNRNYEISINRLSENIISVAVGSTIKNQSFIIEGKDRGHYHPTNFFDKLGLPEDYPRCILSGLLPSYGDIRTYLLIEDIDGGTRIYSDKGYVEVNKVINYDISAVDFNKYRDIYFDLFLGKNSNSFSNDEDVIGYFKKEIGLDLKFVYNNLK